LRLRSSPEDGPWIRVKGAIDHFQGGDFDLVLLGQSIPAEARERLTFLIRAKGAHVPVACIASSWGHHDSFADATFEQDSTDLLTGMWELLRSKARIRTGLAILDGTSTKVPAAQN
jgi:hypothetical protein